jgi:hypothetical protein
MLSPFVEHAEMNTHDARSIRFFGRGDHITMKWRERTRIAGE